MTKCIYSLGHSSRSEQVFLRLLSSYGIGCLIDIRRFPGSRRHPHFSRGALETTLARASIHYVHLGDSLGGFRDVDYERYAESEAFRAGLGLLEGHAQETTSAFMCAEKNPWQCHRRFIAAALARRGFTVQHILDAETVLLGPALGG